MNNENNNEGMPVIKFRGTPFYIDAEKEQFIEVGNPLNCISLDHVVELDDSIFGIEYNEKTRNISSREHHTDYQDTAD